MFVLGTAGHIDHGKSALVQALTGIDPDRLREEKERGMTIDLGFAWLKLPSGREVGVVDVPGHEHFIKNMLAGVGGIDLAMLVVAANEGVMPQTREHLAIIDLLGIRKGVVAITKKDLVDDELLSLVKLEVEELIQPTNLEEAPIVVVSATTGEGLTELLAVIDDLLKAADSRADLSRPRLMIDRIFTISGSGTVVTGTLIDGALSVGQDVEVVPKGLKARLRGLQVHKAQVNIAEPGSRVAANLVGVTTSQLERGDVLTNLGWLTPSTALDVRLKLLPSVRHPLRHGATVNFYTGSTQTLAKIHLLEKEELKPGDDTWAQLTLTKPVAVVRGDHFIIRSSVDTIGGGTIVDPHAKKHRRSRQAVIQNLQIMEKGTSGEVMVAILETEQPLGLARLSLRSGLSADETSQTVTDLVQQGKIVEAGQGEHRLIFTRSGWENLVKRAEAVVRSYHQKFPTRSGIPKGELSSKLKLAPHSVALQRLFDEGLLLEDGASVRISSYQIQLTKDQKAKVEAFVNSLDQNPYSPPGEVMLESELLNLLVQQGRVVKVSDGVVFSTSAYNEMVDKVIAYAKARGKVTVAEVRDMLGTSRKYALALLEYMDEKKLTRRIGDERVLR